MMSDHDNLDIMIGSENVNPFEREIANKIEGSVDHYDTESNSRLKENFSQENELSVFGHENTVPRQDRYLETMATFSNEIILWLSQEMDPMMSK